MDYIKLKASAQKRNNQQNEKATIEWERIFANISEKELKSKIFTELVKLNNKNEQSNFLSEWAEEMNKHLSKEDIQIDRRPIDT